MRNQKIRSRKLFLSIRHLLFSPFILVWLILPQGVCLGATYTLTITANNGSVRVNPDKVSYDEGEKVELIPKPDTGYCFISWAGDAQGKRLVLTVTMDSDKTIIANFIPWQPPIGILEPEFGIKETYRMYDDPRKRNPSLTYTQNAKGGYYTHYIDNTHPAATDTSNPYGTASKPRMTIPPDVPEGSVVEIHGGPYNFYNRAGKMALYGYGTADRPIFFRGASINERPSFSRSGGLYPAGSYVILENLLLLNDTTIAFRPYGISLPFAHHIAVRHCEMIGSSNHSVIRAVVYIGADYVEEGALSSYIVIYNNTAYNYGDWQYAGENDAMGVGVGGFDASDVWIVDNELFHMGGDSIRVGTGVEPDPEHPAKMRNAYIGRNIMYENGENAVDVKPMQNVVISENIMYGFDGNSGDPGSAIVVHNEPTNTWVINNIIYNAVKGVMVSDGNDVFVIGNVFYNISDALEFWADNEIHFISNTVFGMEYGVRDLGVNTNPHPIVNNIFTNITGSGYHIQLNAAADNSLMQNNLIYEPDGTFRVRWRGTTYTSLESFQSSIGKGEGCLVDNPQFVNPAAGNFRLQSGSPAIDNGTSIDYYTDLFASRFGVDIAKDIDGNPRPLGSAWDIGAYEYTLLPFAIIQNEPKQGYAPLTVSFDGSQSKSPHGDIVSYEWDFGDGITSTKIKTKHIFTSIGEYTVTLTVTDELGLKGKSQTRITVFEKEFGELPPGCYNNVFNPTKGEKALIVVELQKQSHVRLNLYNTRGDKIRELADEEKEADVYKYYWDGKDDSGNVVGSGLYFAHIQAGDYKKTKKIVVIK